LVLNEDFDRHVNYNYYLVDELGNRTKITQIIDVKNRIQRRPCVLVGGSGTIGQTIEPVKKIRKKREYFFQTFMFSIRTPLIEMKTIKTSKDLTH
jgi:hypothetical protein